MEFLVRLRHVGRLCVVIHFPDDLVEVGWAVKVAGADGVAVSSDHFINSIHSRVEDIACQGETVTRAIGKGRNCASEPVKIDHLVRVVELEDVTHASNCLQILVAIRIEVMEGRCRVWVPI